MLEGWTRRLRVRMHRAAVNCGSSRRRRHGGVWEWVLTILTGLLLAGGIIWFLGTRLRPVVEAAARTQAENAINQLVEEAILADLSRRELGYGDLVTIQRDGSGTITALTTDMAAMNLLRGQLVECVLGELKGLEVSAIQIPLGSLLSIDWLWAKGPSVRLHSMSVGTVSAEFESEFTSAGVNQTLHRIWLETKIPLTLMLPGDRVETQVGNRLCIAETVIVGKVPNVYLQTVQR